MKPPWDEYPQYDRSDLGWRMGDGQSYLEKFEAWFSAQAPEARAEFAESNPAPESWLRFYTSWDVPMAPPWRRYPELTQTSWEWREVHAPRNYWATFHDWLLRLEPQAMNRYASNHPEPDDWSEFYSSIGIRTD